MFFKITLGCPIRIQNLILFVQENVYSGSRCDTHLILINRSSHHRTARRTTGATRLRHVVLHCSNNKNNKNVLIYVVKFVIFEIKITFPVT